MEETALQYCQRLIDLITLGDKDISIKQRLIHLKNKIEDESRPVQAGVMQKIAEAIENLINDAYMKIQSIDLREPDELNDAITETWQYQIDALTDLLGKIESNFSA